MKMIQYNAMLCRKPLIIKGCLDDACTSPVGLRTVTRKDVELGTHGVSPFSFLPASKTQQFD